VEREGVFEPAMIQDRQVEITGKNGLGIGFLPAFFAELVPNCHVRTSVG
jgi:hypothetical protein